jgi:hypothetical protein
VYFPPVTSPIYQYAHYWGTFSLLYRGICSGLIPKCARHRVVTSLVYKVIVEMQNDMHWFWRSDRDKHGTTANGLEVGGQDAIGSRPVDLSSLQFQHLSQMQLHVNRPKFRFFLHFSVFLRCRQHKYFQLSYLF